MVTPSPSRQTPFAVAGFSLLELLVVVAAVVMLAAMLAPSALQWMNEGKATRAHGDAAGIAAAMNRFFIDTARWPGQVEILASGGTLRYVTVGNPTAQFPAVEVSLGISESTCVEGLSGVISNTTKFEPTELSPSSALNINNLLLYPPSAADYPNWRGPYLPTTFEADPWGSQYVINLVPLFCGEPASAEEPGGALGFGWILSGGPNQTLQTPFTAKRPAVDDAGYNLNKRLAQSPQ